MIQNTKQSLLERHYSVTIVVPMYSVEPFIERCAVSLFEQDFDDIEYIFVNDATPDNSVAILENIIKRYPQRANHVQIIHNAENLGLFETRKIGVMAANGDYIQHIDSDDWVESDMISGMYATAKAGNLDVVACDFHIHNECEVRYKSEQHPLLREDILTALLATDIRVNIWSRLVKRELYLTVYQSLNLSKYQNMGEDRLIILPLYIFANTIGHVPRGFYHYNRQNTTALTAKNRAKSYQEAQFVFTFLSQFLQDKITDKQTRLFKYVMFRRLLSLSDALGEKPNIRLLRQYHFGLRELWALRQVAFSQKLLYSLHFVNLSKGVVVIRYLKNAYRAIRGKIIR